MAKELGGLFGTNADAPLDGQVPVWHSVPGSDPNAGLGFWVPTTSGGGSGDVVGPAASVDGEIALYDGITGKLLKRATGTGIVRVTSGVYGTPGNVVESEITLADNTTNNVSNTKHGFAPKNPNDATKYLDGTGAYSVPAGTAGITQLTGDVTAGPGSGSQAATLAASGVSAGTVGDATHVAQTTVDAKGRVTALTSVAITFPSGGGFGFTAPVNADWSWVNQGSASVTSNTAILGGGNQEYLLGVAAAGPSIHMRVRNSPSTPWTRTFIFIPLIDNINFQACGVVFYDSGSGKLIFFAYDETDTFSVSKWNSTTSFSGTYTVTSAWRYRGPFLAFKIEDDGANRACYISFDGVNFQGVHSVGRTDFATCDQIGFAVKDQNINVKPAMTLLSYA
jgi:hypothetical protein